MGEHRPSAGSATRPTLIARVRAAWLAFQHPELAAACVCVVRVFDTHDELIGRVEQRLVLGLDGVARNWGPQIDITRSGQGAWMEFRLASDPDRLISHGPISGHFIAGDSIFLELALTLDASAFRTVDQATRKEGAP